MKAYEVDYAAKIDVFGTYPVNASDADQAEEMTLEYLRDTYPHYFEAEVEMVREINLG